MTDDFEPLLASNAFGTDDPPRIFHEYSELSDVRDPDALRWRAFWSPGLDGLPHSIRLVCYPVVKRTRCGAWIDPFAYRKMKRWTGDEAEYEWSGWTPDRPTDTLKFVYDDASAAWAKETPERALKSLGVRLTRWSRHLERAVNRMNAACDVASALLTAETREAGPDHATFVRGSSDPEKFKLPAGERDRGRRTGW